MFEEPGAREPVKLQWARVRSSNVKGIGWHDGSLYVWFKSDVAYRYPEVSKATFELILQAKSKGKAVAAAMARPQGLREARRRARPTSRSWPTGTAGSIRSRCCCGARARGRTT
jgi:hypothetical protein